MTIVDFLSQAALSATLVVVMVTQALKYIPVEWTSKYAVWVNILLSFIGAVSVQGMPVFSSTNLWVFLVQWGTIVLIAAMAYNHVLSKALAPSIK